MTDLEQHVYDLVTHGIRGDALAVRQLARRMLNAAPVVSDANRFYTALERLLAQPTESPWPAAPGDPLGSLLRAELSPAVERPVLAGPEQRAIDAIVAERAALSTLVEAGLEPTKTLLLTGAPGVGKTMTATYLAAALDLPLLTLDLAEVVSRYLGQTGQNLRQAMEAARSNPCVLLLDEFDAVAKRRDDPADIGELKRIVNVLLLELERWPAEGLLIAATNHPELLDRAIWRRFDRVLEMGLPDRNARETILTRAISRTSLPTDQRMVRLFAEAAEGLSGSDLVRQVRSAARESVLEPCSLGQALARSALSTLADRMPAGLAGEALCALAHHGAGFSLHQIAELLATPYSTVRRRVRSWEAREDAQLSTA